MADQTSGRQLRIVVGVDGSPCSKAALRWALNQARVIDATVEVIDAWQEPTTYGLSYGLAPEPFDGAMISATTQKVLAETVAEVAAQLDRPVDVLARVVLGHPARVLIDTAEGAHLLVVGRCGHSGLAGMLLGSVSQHCIQLARCPVVVVPDDQGFSSVTRDSAA